MSARGVLVTGTDTGVGKTLVASALAAALSERMRVAVFKPAETGCAERDGGLRPEDAVRLREAAASDDPLDLVCPYRYAEPLAPFVAAERTGRPISPGRLGQCFRELAAGADFVIVETAGGLLVPLTGSYSFADLAADLELLVLLVVGSRLGALNQTLLTIECARSRRLGLVGYVLNETSPGTDLARATNAAALEHLTEVPRIASVPFVESGAETLSRQALAAIGEPIVARLFEAARER